MNIGSVIKKCRKSLGITQKELVNSHISRNLLSEIENNNVEITKKNALFLYSNLHYFSFIKNIPIDINFDKILSSESQYIQLKHAIVSNKTLLKIKNGIYTVDQVDLSKTKNLFYEVSYRNLRIVMLKNLGDILGLNGLLDEQCEVYMRAYSDLWMDKNIKELTGLAKKIILILFKLGQYEEITKIFDRLFKEYELNKSPVEPSMYFNNALALTKLMKNTKAIEMIDKYLGYDYEFINYPKALLLKANCYSRLNEFDIAKELYLQSSSLSLEKKDYGNYCLSISNIIDTIITKNTVKNESSISKINYYINEIERNLSMKKINEDTLSRIYENISSGYLYTDQYEMAKNYSIKASQLYLKHNEYSNYISVLYKAVDIYYRLNDLEELYTKYLDPKCIDTSEFSSLLMNNYEKILLKICLCLLDKKDYLFNKVFNTIIQIKGIQK